MTQSDLITLPPCSEYRFELEPNERFSIKLISGQAEIFGAELVCEKWYGFQDEAKGALSTWNGAQIEMSIQELRSCVLPNRTEVRERSTGVKRRDSKAWMDGRDR